MNGKIAPMAINTSEGVLPMPPKKVDGVKLYDIRELAEKLGVTTRTIQAYIGNYQKQQGIARLRAQKIGRKWYVSEGNLHAFLNREDPDDLQARLRDALERGRKK